MNKQEVTQIITILAGNYEGISKKTKEQKQIMISTWLECLGDLDYNIALQATKVAMMTSPYMPTISNIRENYVKLTNPEQPRTGIEAWNEAYKLICRGAYMTQEEFEKASPEVRKFFGSVRQLKEAYSTNTELNMDVARSNFLKQYEVITAREKQDRLLPARFMELASNIAKQVEVQRLESGN